LSFELSRHEAGHRVTFEDVGYGGLGNHKTPFIVSPLPRPIALTEFLVLCRNIHRPALEALIKPACSSLSATGSRLGDVLSSRGHDG